MHIKRPLGLAQTELKFADNGSFKGYASVWDGLDSYGDTIKRGAYLDTLKTHGMPKMFYNHQHDLPVGKYTLADEDSKGLWVEGEITPGIARAADMSAAMRHQTIDGLSVGGTLAADGITYDKGVRVIHKWDYLMEVSPVVFPADGNARIDLSSVKSADVEGCNTERDIERLLRDAGLGKREAMAFISRAKVVFAGRDAQQSDDGVEALLNRINGLDAHLKGKS